MLRQIPSLSLVVAVVALVACSTPRIPGVYRIDVQQGNVVTQEMLDKLDPGMEKRKVRFVLGTPLLIDTFNPDRWDYMYSFQPGSGERVQRRISLHFENDKLARIEGDIKPSGRRRTTPRRTETVVIVPDREDEGFFSSLAKPFRKDEPEEPVASETDQQQTAAEPTIGKDAPEEEDGGFFSRLVERLRRSDAAGEEGQSEGEAEAESQPARTEHESAP